MALQIALLNPALGGYAPWLAERIDVPVDIRVPASFRDEDVLPLLPAAEIVLTSYWYPAWGRAAKRLRFLQIPGAGWDKIDPTAIPDGVLVANCYEHERAIAEYVMMVCLAFSRELLPADRALRQGDWSYFPDAGHPLYRELGGRTIGLVGLGRIGQAVATLAGAFGMRRIGLDAAPVSVPVRVACGLEWVGTPASLDHLLAEADFVVLAVPLLEETRGMIGARELGLLKRTAYLINPARAQLVDERALYEALRDRRFAGAALDPLWQYPKAGERIMPSRFPFHELDNVIMTPHISGTTQDTVDRRFAVVAANINRFLRGEVVINVVSELSRASGLRAG